MHLETWKPLSQNLNWLWGSAGQRHCRCSQRPHPASHGPWTHGPTRPEPLPNTRWKLKTHAAVQRWFLCSFLSCHFQSADLKFLNAQYITDVVLHGWCFSRLMLLKCCQWTDISALNLFTSGCVIFVVISLHIVSGLMILKLFSRPT